MDEESREFLEGRIYPIDETTILIDEKWLESFVRSIVIKTLAEVHWNERDKKDD